MISGKIHLRFPDLTNCLRSSVWEGQWRGKRRRSHLGVTLRLARMMARYNWLVPSPFLVSTSWVLIANFIWLKSFLPSLIFTVSSPLPLWSLIFSDIIYLCNIIFTLLCLNSFLSCCLKPHSDLVLGRSCGSKLHESSIHARRHAHTRPKGSLFPESLSFFYYG